MKIILLVSFLLVEVAYSTPVAVETSEFSQNSTDELFMMSIYNFLNRKCPNEEDATKNVTEILKEVGDCLSPFGQNSSEQLTTADRFCQHPKTIEKIPECFIPVVDIVRDCGDEEEKYLPDFILETILNTLVFLCANAEENLKKFTQESAHTCLESIDEENKLTLTTCIGEGEGGFIAMLADGVLTKKKLCDTIEAEKVCYVNHMDKVCPNSDLKKLFGDLVDVMASPCSK